MADSDHYLGAELRVKTADVLQQAIAEDFDTVFILGFKGDQALTASSAGNDKHQLVGYLMEFVHDTLHGADEEE